MASKLSIVNQALAMLGQDPTDTVVLQDAKAATRKLLVFCDQALDEVLTFHPWVDVLTRRSLSPIVEVDDDEADWKYPYVFELPTGCLRVIDVADGCVAWQVATRKNGGAEDKVLRANGPGPLRLTFIRRIDWAALPTHLITPAATRLAALACYSVTGDNAKQRDLEERAEARLTAALGKDGSQEGGQEPLFEDHLGDLRRSCL